MPTATKMAASSAERCATARPPSFRSTWGIWGVCWAPGNEEDLDSSPPFAGFCLISMPPMMRWTIAESTNAAMRAASTNESRLCQNGIENT